MQYVIMRIYSKYIYYIQMNAKLQLLNSDNTFCLRKKLGRTQFASLSTQKELSYFDI